ncbi:MAG: ADP-ribosylglycohydrolase family protein [Akkermansiaceae bacterium]
MIPTMKEFYRTALVADSLSLGSHWIYDSKKIEARFPSGVRIPEAPMAEYHGGKVAGDLTHYGDQTVLLARSIEKRGGFDTGAWRDDWLEGMQDFGGYVDGASRESKASGGRSPSSSSDLGGAARIAPILDLGLVEDDAVAAAIAQTKLTHGDPVVAEAAEFFTRSSYEVRRGKTIRDALEEVARQYDFPKLNAKEVLEQGLVAQEMEPKAAAAKFGAACGTLQAFPLAIYFLIRNEEFENAISENAMVGGDSSARSMLMALLYAAKDPKIAKRHERAVNALK